MTNHPTAPRFAGKVTLVTGAGIGIGYAMCRAFAHEGARVALNDINAALAQEAADKLNRELDGDCVAAFPCDIGDVAAVRGMVESVAQTFGRLDVCVANAGITIFGQFLEYEPTDFDRMLGVNLRGTFFTAQSAARVMISGQIPGRIILMSSVAGIQAIGGLGPYGMTKAGIRMMARTLAYELGPHGITVNAVGPGATVTERTLKETANYEEHWATVTPTRRAAHVEDIAAAALFLASDEARHINGQTLMIDGGWTSYSPVPPEY